jgi:NAD-specific glutamate dehydrogenase
LTKLKEFKNIYTDLSDALCDIKYTPKGGSNQTYTKLLDHFPTETEMNQMDKEIRKAIGEKLKLENRLNYFKNDPYKKVTYSLSFSFKPPADDDMPYLEALFGSPGAE